MRTQMTNRQFYARVKAGFVLKETSLHAWCIRNKIRRQNARDALLGEWTGDGANALRERLAIEAGITKDDLITISHEHLA
jgi:hypothetical protein